MISITLSRDLDDEQMCVGWRTGSPEVSPRMFSLPRSLALAGLALALLCPATALADSSVNLWTSLSVQAKAPAAELRHIPMGSPALRGGAGVAHSVLVPGLQLWASGVGYAVGRRSAGYRMAAGAAVPLREHLSMTAGYRITGFSGGSQLDGNVATVDGRIAAAYIGFDLEF